jgi:hypothetical protein
LNIDIIDNHLLIWGFNKNVRPRFLLTMTYGYNRRRLKTASFFSNYIMFSYQQRILPYLGWWAVVPREFTYKNLDKTETRKNYIKWIPTSKFIILMEMLWKWKSLTISKNLIKLLKMCTSHLNIAATAIYLSFFSCFPLMIFFQPSLYISA